MSGFAQNGTFEMRLVDVGMEDAFDAFILQEIDDLLYGARSKTDQTLLLNRIDPFFNEILTISTNPVPYG
jgi:hypothetical protein